MVRARSLFPDIAQHQLEPCAAEQATAQWTFIVALTMAIIWTSASMTHASIPPEERAKTGLSDSLIRISVGIEDAEDLVADLEQAIG